MKIRLFNTRSRGVTEEQLSAYLDGSLDAAARARVEAEAARSQELRARLDAMRFTVATLRSAEPVRAPRSFALTPAMAYGAAKPITGPRINPLMPAMAAAAAALAVGLLLVGNLTGTLRQAGEEATGARQATKEVAELSVPAQEGGVPSGPEGAAVGGTAATVVVEKEFSRAAAVPATPTIEAALAPSAPPAMMAAAASDQATQTVAPGAPAGPKAAQETPIAVVATPPAAEKAALGDAPAPSDVSSTSYGEPGQEPAAAESGVGLPLWQLEALLGALAVAFAATAVVMALQRQRGSRP